MCFLVASGGLGLGLGVAKDLARKWLLDGKVALKDGNFPAVEEKSHMVLRLADGWQPPGWTEIKGLGRVR